MERNKHIECLDGLRGIAAFWVLTGHAMFLTGWGFRLITRADLAVDLFILLSGFLMTFHYESRKEAEPWVRSSTWMIFWLRRFFRIAPLYYFALVIALILGPQIGEMRNSIAVLLPETATEYARYADQSFSNLLIHVSFVFGMLPDYAFRTALPDWSIGLEMQYYIAFPFIMLLWLALGPVFAAVLLCAGLIVTAFFGHSFLAEFPMPSILIAKLSVFLAGMLIAHGMHLPFRKAIGYLALAVIAALLPIWHFDGISVNVVRALLVMALFGLVTAKRLPERFGLREIGRLGNKLLSRAPLRFMGDVSFGVYLVHLLVLIPVAGFLIKTFGTGMAPMTRFFIAYAVTLAVVYPLAWLLHIGIEMNGIRLGQQVVRWFRSRWQPAAAGVATSR